MKIKLTLVLHLVSGGIILGPFWPKSVMSEPTPSAELRELSATIARMDAEIFDAFNAHNVDAVVSRFTADLEFY